MTNTLRDLLISLASHMAYMQGQLEAHHEHDDPEDYYWYRESVLLRQKVTDALLTDEPAVPEGREPAAVTGQPSDAELLELTPEHTARHPDSDSYSEVIAAYRYVQSVISTADAQSPVGGYAWHGWALREAFLAGCTHVHSAPSQPAPPADWEVAELAAQLTSRNYGPGALDRAAELLQRQALVPVSVSERLPGPEDCNAEGKCWLCGKVEGDWRLINPEKSGVPHLKYCFTHWLPAHALPRLGVNND